MLRECWFYFSHLVWWQARSPCHVLCALKGDVASSPSSSSSKTFCVCSYSLMADFTLWILCNRKLFLTGKRSRLSLEPHIQCGQLPKRRSPKTGWVANVPNLQSKQSSTSRENISREVIPLCRQDPSIYSYSQASDSAEHRSSYLPLIRSISRSIEVNGTSQVLKAKNVLLREGVCC